MFTLVAAPLVSAAVLFGGSLSALAQNPNPQRSFAAQEYLANPSLVLNFNDLASSFRERVSGLNFVNTKTVVTSAPIGGNAPTGNAYTGNFDGTTNYVTTASVSTLSPPAITVSAWVYVSGFPAPYNTVMASANTYQALFIKSNGKLATFVATSGGNVGNDGTGAAVLAVGNWYFLSYTYDSVNGLKVYVNGVLDSSLAASGTLLAATGQTIIGYYTSAYPRNWKGVVSNVSLYNVALTSTQINTLYGGGTISSGLIGQWKLNEGSGTTAIDTSTGGNNGTWVGAAKGNFGYYEGSVTTVYNSGTVTVRQPGFDLTQPNNTSAGFPFNGLNIAPNNILGAIEWNVPWSMLVHIDRLNWNRTGTMVLASKGDISSISNNWWDLTVAMNGAISQLCFSRNGVNVAGSAKSNAGGAVCTSAGYDAMPNGLSYDIVLTDKGDGTPNALTMAINGMVGGSGGIPVDYASNSYQYGFGAVNLTISGGTGYANSTAFTSTGGGPNCKVTGSIPATSGVPAAGVLGLGSFSYYNAGCASLPTIVLTSPAGTGISIVESLAGASMNASTLPLMVPGAVNAGAYNGPDQADSTQTSTYVDEFAIFPGVISGTEIQGLAYQTKFYQTILGAVPAVKKNIIIDEDGCNDLDDAMTVAMAIRYHLLGYANLIGIVSESGGADAAMYRQMLDQAGLNHVPASVSSGAGGGGYCSAANITTYNASTPQVVSAYPLAATMYRKVFAAYSTTPIYVLMGGAFTGLSDFMKSAADGISSLTGQQLFNQNATNGAYIVAQGLGCNPTTLPNTLPCTGSVSGDNSLLDYQAGQEVVNNNGIEPIYWTGGTPAGSGPGMYVTRTSKDPLYLAAVTDGADSRTCWDCMAVTELLTNYFVGGVQLGVSGGTGYANQTAFTSNGGGANCLVTGFMLASGGVPSGSFDYSWGAASAAYPGIGSQCLTAPTIILTAPTGAGAVVTAYPTSVCGTYTITSSTAGSIASTACNHHYFQPYAANMLGPGTSASGAAFGWFTNSLLNPESGGDPRMQ